MRAVLTPVLGLVAASLVAMLLLRGDPWSAASAGALAIRFVVGPRPWYHGQSPWVMFAGDFLRSLAVACLLVHPSPIFLAFIASAVFGELLLLLRFRANAGATGTRVALFVLSIAVIAASLANVFGVEIGSGSLPLVLGPDASRALAGSIAIGVSLELNEIAPRGSRSGSAPLPLAVFGLSVLASPLIAVTA